MQCKAGTVCMPGGSTLDRFPFIRECNCAYNYFERVPGGYIINTIN